MAAPSLDEIKALLEQSAYNPAIVPQLEAYIGECAAGKAAYHFEVCRSLIKLYQFNPQLVKPETISRILLLALLEFPSTDLLALLSLVPEHLQSSEPASSIIRCAELLDSCQFSEFWGIFKTLEGDSNLKSLASGATGKLRQSIVNVLALSYRSAPLTIVTAALDMEDSAAIAKFENVEVVEGGSVNFVPTTDNTKRDRVFQEGVNFSAISNLLSKASVTSQ